MRSNYLSLDEFTRVVTMTPEGGQLPGDWWTAAMAESIYHKCRRGKEVDAAVKEASEAYRKQYTDFMERLYKVYTRQETKEHSGWMEWMKGGEETLKQWMHDHQDEVRDAVCGGTEAHTIEHVCRKMNMALRKEEEAESHPAKLYLHMLSPLDLSVQDHTSATMHDVDLTFDATVTDKFNTILYFDNAIPGKDQELHVVPKSGGVRVSPKWLSQIFAIAKANGEVTHTDRGENTPWMHISLGGFLTGFRQVFKMHGGPKETEICVVLEACRRKKKEAIPEEKKSRQESSLETRITVLRF